MKNALHIGLTLAMLAAPLAGLAQEDHSGHGASISAEPSDAASRAYMDGMAVMNRDMMAKMTGNADVDFAAMMIPHHKGAIAMARTQLQYGKDPELRKLSQAIVKAQENEIAFLKGWLGKNADPAASADHGSPSSRAYMDGMARMEKDMAAMSGDPDRNFAVMMIPHHQGAIDMAKVQLEFGKDAELKALSEAVIKAQAGEIKVLRGWLRK